MIAKLKRLLNGIEQVGVLGARCQELERDNAALKERNIALSDSYSKKKQEATTLAKKLAEIDAKVREQSEADLVLTSLKIIEGALRGKTKDELSPLASIQRQQIAAHRAMQSSPNYYGGALGNLGGVGGSLLGLGG